jgi:hypothetical protein
MEVVLAIGMALLFPTLVLIRGGNDAYQVVFPQEVAMARQAIEETPPGREIVPLSGLGPYGVEGIDTHSHGSVIPGCSQLANDPVRCIEAENPDVLLTFTSVEKEGVVLNNKPPGWSLEVIQQLVASGRYVVTYQDGFNAMLKKVVLDPVAPARGG